MKALLQVKTPDSDWETVSMENYDPESISSIGEVLEKLAKYKDMWIALEYFPPSSKWRAVMDGHEDGLRNKASFAGEFLLK